MEIFFIPGMEYSLAFVGFFVFTLNVLNAYTNNRLRQKPSQKKSTLLNDIGMEDLVIYRHLQRESSN